MFVSLKNNLKSLQFSVVRCIQLTILIINYYYCPYGNCWWSSSRSVQSSSLFNIFRFSKHFIPRWLSAENIEEMVTYLGPQLFCLIMFLNKTFLILKTLVIFITNILYFFTLLHGFLE
jgi:hypothetical protein